MSRPGPFQNREPKESQAQAFIATHRRFGRVRSWNTVNNWAPQYEGSPGGRLDGETAGQSLISDRRSPCYCRASLSYFLPLPGTWRYAHQY